MDLVFARCVDHLSLSGSSGATLLSLASAAVGDSPRPALLRFLSDQFRHRPSLFSSPDWTASPATLRLIAVPSLCYRALGHALVEHPTLPQQACLVLQHVGRAGPAGILQSELASLVGLSPVMVSHYLGALSARRLVARKRVVLTTTRPQQRHPTDSGARHGETEGPQLIIPRTNAATRVTSTTVIVLARFASVIASSNASKRITGVMGVPPPPPMVDGSVYPSHPASGEGGPEVSIHELHVNEGADRVLTALRAPPYIRTQKDLKVIAMPDHEKPDGFTGETYQRRRHRAFRAFRVRLQRAGLITVVERECIDSAGRSRGVHTCLKLANAPELEVDDDDVVAPVVVDNEEAVSAVEDINIDEELEAGQVATVGKEVVGDQSAASKSNGAGFVAEVDLIQQIYSLLQEAGAEGLSVPELVAKLDDGTKLTSAPAKRVRNIITGISRFVPIAESQKFEGSAMCLKNALAEFSDMNASSAAGQGKASTAKLIHGGSAGKSTRVQRRSELGRKKDELTSLGLERQGLVLQLLNENKAVVLETLGRRVAELERDSSVERVDQKVMRRIINDLVLQKRAQVLTTLKPSISKRSQTIRLVTLPNLKANSPEVVIAISTIVSHSIHGKQSTPIASQKRKAEDVLIARDDGTGEGVVNAEPQKRRRRKARTPKRPRSPAKILPRPVQNSIPDESILKEADVYTQANDSPEDSPETPPKNAVVVNKERRDTRRARICRLTAIDYGWMKGKLARIRRFHEHLYDVVCKHRSKEQPVAPAVQYCTVEAAKAIRPLGTFTIQSCLRDMSVGDYAATVGIYNDRGDIMASIGDKKIAHVWNIMEEELSCNQASRQLTSLVQCLVKLELMESSQEGKFALCGAGIIRDFSRGMPTGIVPHGIAFTTPVAVGVYWKELQQFSHFRYAKVPANGDPSVHAGDRPDDTGEHPLADVYVRMRWSKGFNYTFTRDEQFHYEVLLQQMSGVNNERGNDGSVSPSNFILTPLKRFPIAQLLDHVQNVATDSGQKIAREKNTNVVEKLLFYSRFRSRNEAPEEIHEASKPKDATTISQVSAEAHGRVRTVLRLSRGSSSVSGSAVTREVSRTPTSTLPASAKKKLRALKMRKTVDTRPKTVIGVERCVSALREVLQVRTMVYCKDIGVVPRWNIATLFPNTEDEATEERDSIAWTGKRVDVRVDDLNDEDDVSADEKQDEGEVPADKKQDECDVPTDNEKGEGDVGADEKKGEGHLQDEKNSEDAVPAGKEQDGRSVSFDKENDEDVELADRKRCEDGVSADGKGDKNIRLGDKKKNDNGVHAGSKAMDTIVFRQAIVTLCHTPVVQGIVDILSLRLALRLITEQASASLEERLKKLRVELERMWKRIQCTLRAAVLECKAEVYRAHCVVLQQEGNSELWSKQERRKLIEREFRLTSNMRVRHNYKLSEHIVLLVERYRRLAGLHVNGNIWREFVFRDEDVDEVMSVGEERIGPVRVEVMEQVLLSILNAGRQVQKSSDVMSMLSRFRASDIAKARDRMLIREAISVTTTDAMMRFFMITKGEKAGGDTATRHVLQKKSEKAGVWIKGLEDARPDEKDEGYCRFRETELGRDATGKRCLESRKAAMVSTQLVFFQAEGQGSLRLRPLVALGEGQDASTVIDGEAGDEGGLKDKNEKGEQHTSEEEGNEEKAKTEDEIAEDQNAAPTVIDVRFKYENEGADTDGPHMSKRGARTQLTDEMGGKEVEGTDADNRAEKQDLQERVEELLKKGGHMGVTLQELLSSEVALSCMDKASLAGAVQNLLRSQQAYRLPIETAGHPSLPDVPWTSSRGVLYLHASFISPLLAQSNKSHWGNGRSLRSPVVSVWSTFQGRACEALVQGVTRTVVHLLTRKPGTEYTQVVKAVQARFPSVPARAAADVLFVLERKGALSVTRVGRKGGGWNGPFGGGGEAQVRGEDKTGEKGICERFVDGKAFVEEDGREVVCFLHVVPSLSFTEVTGEELCEVGSQMW